MDRTIYPPGPVWRGQYPPLDPYGEDESQLLSAKLLMCADYNGHHTAPSYVGHQQQHPAADLITD